MNFGKPTNTALSHRDPIAIDSPSNAIHLLFRWRPEDDLAALPLAADYASRKGHTTRGGAARAPPQHARRNGRLGVALAAPCEIDVLSMPAAHGVPHSTAYAGSPQSGISPVAIRSGPLSPLSLSHLRMCGGIIVT